MPAMIVATMIVNHRTWYEPRSWADGATPERRLMIPTINSSDTQMAETSARTVSWFMIDCTHGQDNGSRTFPCDAEPRLLQPRGGRPAVDSRVDRKSVV